MKSYAHRRHTGITLIITIATLALLGVALAGVSQQFITQARRTKLEANQAQLRQWLVAGAAEARKQVMNAEGNPSSPVEMKLPPSLQDETTRVIMHLQPQPDHWQVRLHVASEHASVTQLLIFKNEGDLQQAYPPQWDLQSFSKQSNNENDPPSL
jgi:Tfp pilus assembly protein PilX